jgi:aldehyde dehydrogenase (NAD+)
VSFKTEAEAIALANDTPYGLNARVMSKDLERAERVSSQIEAGSIKINDENSVSGFDPFGGYKLSGIGREHGVMGLRELCQVKSIARNK